MRLLAILLSYLGAVLAATLGALVLLIGISLAEGRFADFGQAILDIFEIIGPAFLLVLVLAAVPFVCCVLVLHYLHQKSWLAHVAAGAVVSLAAFFIFAGGLFDPGILLEIWYMPVAGAIGGFAYWLCRYRLLREMTAA
ncbi:MAG: hypothetical protein P0Y65_14160 [Candidatus Devosia phytovorans]|uniref:Uncharacterized protein n=1 Tax=Candidatus Devosia phytovorans TaxID=3121372 RepID=A0AAJ5VTI7_9HYPH|nr:hypothetical protein [Devosia sp.]WEK03332.1 MAG: hypothetical protein P0Y65_14160 [Devosia sp.]